MPWLLAVVLGTAAPHAEHLPPWLTLLAIGVFGWRFWLWKQRRGLPTRLPLVLLVIAGSAGIAWEYRTLFGRDAGVALLFFFMALKPMEMRTRRDAMVLIMLGFFLLLTHYLYAQGIFTGLWLLASTLLLIAALIRLHGGAQPAPGILRYAALMLAQALPFMLLLFLLFPRIEGPLWGLPRDAHSGLTGLSNQMSPGSLNKLIQSGAIAFRVQFSDGIPGKSQLYWRGPVLELFDGQTWRSRFQQRATSPSTIAPLGKSFSYVLTLEPHNQRWLLALDLPVRLPNETLLTDTFEARSRSPVTSRARFAFTSSPSYTANPQEAPSLLQHALRLPPGLNAKARKMAEEWRSSLQTPERISDAALRFFREEAFYYTLQPPLLDQNSVDDFLFVTRRGFCEHFASAYVFLMRAAGIPARVVTGYQGGEVNPIDGYLTVRQSDAHAWAEIWLEGKGWGRIDPTAAVSPLRIEQGIDVALPATDSLPALVRLRSDWLRDLRNRWEATNNAWNQWVLGYNPQLQREVLERLGFSEPDWRSMTAVLALSCATVLFLVTLWALFQRTTETPAQRAWNRFCARLKPWGITRAAWEGPLDFAARVAREHPEIGAVTQEAAGHFADVHYGIAQAGQLQQLKDCMKRLNKNPSLSRRNLT